MPIHPSVVRHFDLPYADAATRYPRLYEGSYTFEDFALRYMRNEWNRSLAEGLSCADSNPERALTLLDEALRASPDSGEGWYARAEILRAQQRFDEVEDSIARAVEAEPDSAKYHYGLAHELLRQGHLAAAAELARRSIELDGGDLDLHGLGGEIALRLGDNPLARACGLRMLELESNSGFAEYLVGQAALRGGDFGEAAIRLARACALSPESAGFHLAYSEALHRAGRLSQALEAARNAAVAAPESALLQERVRDLEREVAEAGQNLGRGPAGTTADPPMSDGSSTGSLPMLPPDILAADGEAVDRQARELTLLAAGRADAVQLVFGLNGNAAGALSEGWSPQEDGFVWTLGRHSVLRIDNPLRGRDVELFIEFAPFVHGGVLPRQRLTLAVNDVACPRLEIVDQTVLRLLIPASLAGAGRMLRLSFHCPDAARPDAVCGVTDQREIAFAARRLWLFPATGPDAFAAASEAALGRVAALSDCEVMSRFESLGENCEFGLVQRRCGVEQLGLLRFASAPYDKLLAALQARFAGVGEAENILIQQSNGEYLVHDCAFGFLHHAWALVSEVSLEAVHARQARRLPFLVRKLLGDLAVAEKIFVFHAMEPLPPAHAKTLAAAVRMYGPGTLLWMDNSDAEHPDATVEEIEPGLMKGYLERFAPGENAHDLPLESWIRLCRVALGMMQ